MNVEDLLDMLENDNELPDGFNDWGMVINDETISHVAARYLVLPSTFDQWDIRDKNGWSVAHVTASYDSHRTHYGLPWDLRGPNGITVAHVAARNNHISLFYNNPQVLSLGDNNSLTVAHVLAGSNNLDSLSTYSKRNLREIFYYKTLDKGLSVSHLLALNEEIPYDNNILAITDKSGITVAEIAAMSNTLPKGFKEWDICNKNNMTLKEIRKKWHPNEN